MIGGVNIMKQYKQGTYAAIAKKDLEDMEFLLKERIPYLAALSAHHSISS